MKKIFSTLSGLLIVFSILMSSVAYAGSTSFDVSIDRVRVNGQVVSESKSNFLNDADVFAVGVDFTTVETLEKGHVEAFLRARQSGNVVAYATGTFDLAKNQSSSSSLALRLIDRLTREDDYDLTVKIIDSRGRSEQKSYQLKTRQTSFSKSLDLSIDRVRVNNKVVAQSSANTIDESNSFDVLVEFTALENLNNAHIEAVLRDINSGTVVADASANFNLARNSASSRLMHVELLNEMKRSNALELSVKVTDADGNSIAKSYGLRMRNGAVLVSDTGNLDISVSGVEIENTNIMEDRTNYLALGSKKDLSLKVVFTPRENLKQSRVDAILTFENGDSISETTSLFDASKDQSTVKTFKFTLPNSKFTQSTFDLRLKFIDNDENFLVKDYIIKLTPQKNPFAASVVSFSPENAQAGKSLGVSVDLRNLGTMPLEGIILKASIPELNLESTRFIDQFKGQTAEFLFKIPQDASSGTYTFKVEVDSQVSGNTLVREIPFYISEKSEQVLANEVSVTVTIFEQSLKNDGSEAAYPITLRNNGIQSSTYTLLLSGNDNLNLRLGESNTFILGAGETKTIDIYASSTGKSAGRQTFFATIKSNGKTLQTVPFRANITGAGSAVLNGVKAFLKWVLIIVAVVLAGIGLAFGAMKLLSNGKKPEAEEANSDLASEIPDAANGEAYY